MVYPVSVWTRLSEIEPERVQFVVLAAVQYSTVSDGRVDVHASCSCKSCSTFFGYSRKNLKSCFESSKEATVKLKRKNKSQIKQLEDLILLLLILYKINYNCFCCASKS